ncbi:MAG: DsbC family protein [Pseudomonadales bacterium]|nr:DsbC family protein [Pseudomonadales bacterium]
MLSTAQIAFSEEGKRLSEVEITAKISRIFPDIPIDNVSKSPVNGIYAIEMVGGELWYATSDGEYFFAGDLYRVADNKIINMAEIGRAKKRKVLMDNVAEEDMVVFSPKTKVRASISVFTDIDCGYCRKLHSEVPMLNEMGIEVKYLAFPRSGIGKGSYNVMVSTWCAEDRNTAMTLAKNGKAIPGQDCDNPVDAQFQLGQNVGVHGTPAIVLTDGTLISGYMPAADLSRRLGL